MGQKQKTEKKERKKERGERDRTMVITMASYALQRHLVWRTQSHLGQNVWFVSELLITNPMLVLLDIPGMSV